MVTRKRKIETEQDRFGGFEDVAPIEKSIFRTSDTMKVPNENRMFGRTTTQEPDILYSGRDTEKIYVQPEQSRIRRSTALSEEDLMPSIKTMSFADQKKKFDSREKMEGKTKVMLAVYMLIVVLLAAIVIGTGIVINSLNANIGRLSTEVESSNAVIATQNEELAKLNDPYRIMGVAKDSSGLNMEEIPANSYKEIEIIPFVENTQTKRPQNWFDKFCDWMQDMLGG